MALNVVGSNPTIHPTFTNILFYFQKFLCKKGWILGQDSKINKEQEKYPVSRKQHKYAVFGLLFRDIAKR